MDREGHTYERSAIEAWLANNNTSPITRSYLHRSHLVPNRSLASLIEGAGHTKVGIPGHGHGVAEYGSVRAFVAGAKVFARYGGSGWSWVGARRARGRHVRRGVRRWGLEERGPGVGGS